MKYGFGVDVGGTTVKLGLFNENGDLIENREIPSRTENGGAAILPDIASAVAACAERRALADADLLGIGIGVPGPVAGDGTVNRCVNLNWGVFNLHNALGALTGLPVKAGNDANCAALGEYWRGGGVGSESVISPSPRPINTPAPAASAAASSSMPPPTASSASRGSALPQRRSRHACARSRT